MPVLGSRTRALLCLFIVAGATRMQAQGQAPDIPSALTLENAVRLAIDRNPTLAAAKNEVQAAEGDKVAASKRPNPAFSLQFEDYPISTHPGPFFDVQEITSRVDYEIEGEDAGNCAPRQRAGLWRRKNAFMRTSSA